jgi:hypothetical protein
VFRRQLRKAATIGASPLVVSLNASTALGLAARVRLIRRGNSYLVVYGFKAPSAQRPHPVGDGPPDLVRRIFLEEMDPRDRHLGLPW